MEKMKFSERKRETDLGRKLCKPVIRKQQRRSMAEIKTLVELTEKKESARAVYPFRPSGWFQRRGPKCNKFQPDARLDQNLGVRLEWFLGLFRTPNQAKFKSSLDGFSIRTQRCNSRRQIPWHKNPRNQKRAIRALKRIQPESENVSTLPILLLNHS